MLYSLLFKSERTQTMNRIHPIAGAVALFTILTFWLSTVTVELFGSVPQVVWVKTTLPFGLLILVPAIAGAGLSGIRLGAKWRGQLVEAKRKRMPIIAANGLLVLMPSALFLSFKAQAAEFDTAFYGVQALELLAGAINLLLLSLNMRDGFRMTSRRRQVARKEALAKS
jgi:hypothetical protein